MNNRIEELKQEARRFDRLRLESKVDGRPFIDADVTWANKFAELIVQECAKVYRDNVKSDRPLYPTEFSAALVKHFGIDYDGIIK